MALLGQVIRGEQEGRLLPESPGEGGLLGDDLHVAYRLQRLANDRGLLRTTLVSPMVSATVIPEK